MIETEFNKNIHSKALHYLAGIPFREHLGLRANKEAVLESFGFSKGTNIALKREFSISQIEGDDNEIQGYLTNQLRNGRFVSLLLKDGNWESMGGCAVTYIMEQEDLDTKLEFEAGKLRNVTTHNGDLVKINHPALLQTYSRKRSVPSELSGFSNYDEAIPVRLGGGFRLQVDDLTFIDGNSYLKFSGSFSFNDMGSRVLELSGKEDGQVPRFSTNFLVKINKQNLEYNATGNGINADLSSDKQVDTVVKKVITSLFEVDGTAISDLVRNLLAVRPSMKTYQLEGIFSVTDLDDISAEIIDFDGLDTFDIDDKYDHVLSPKEKLLRGQLTKTGFLSTDTECLLLYSNTKSKVEEDVKHLVASPLLENDIKEELKGHFPHTDEVFTWKLTGQVKLARLFENLGIEWSHTEDFLVKCFTNGSNKFTLVSIEGFDLAFWKDNGNLIDCSNIESLSKKLSQITGKEIVKAHFSSIQEGD